jgi:CheY-like chemotaxis protein/HPt (histidine-containing phosphotransfer) domain-containing protein
VHLPQRTIGSGPMGSELAERLQQFRFDGVPQIKTVKIVREPMPYGSVLIVDDMETNVYVAKGLMLPYKLSIDTATSGLAAIEKIKAGAVYDIIFMDHMMPEMDGIMTTKILRKLGYTHSIVALTANAMVGQAEMFLANGFDDFISKPIDIRQLNATLNKLIRNKQPHEVIEAAQKNSEDYLLNSTPQMSVNPELAAIFVRDAEKTLAMLKKTYKNSETFNDEDMQLYITCTHAMKSALANIGETALSSIAYALETAGRERNIAVISDETQPFMDKLGELIEKLTHGKKDNDDEALNEDREYLKDRLLEFRAVCTVYEKKAAKDILVELKRKSWSRPTKEMLDALSERLLHSDFDEAAGIARDYVSDVG